MLAEAHQSDFTTHQCVKTYSLNNTGLRTLTQAPAALQPGLSPTHSGSLSSGHAESSGILFLLATGPLHMLFLLPMALSLLVHLA